MQNMSTPETECNAAWEKIGSNKEQMSRKTSKSLFIWCFFFFYPNLGSAIYGLFVYCLKKIVWLRLGRIIT